MNILMADDDPLITRLLAAHLKTAGYSVMVARHAMQAIMLALRERPDWIVLDVVMPGGTCGRLKNRISAPIASSKPPDLSNLLSALGELLVARQKG